MFWKILLAILCFGMLVFVHEMGHFLAAKAVGVKVNGFSIGLGPRIWGFQVGETDFCLRALPVGGACMMEGEEEDSGDPRAFNNKPIWARFIVLVSGALMNFLTGLLILVLLIMPATQLTTTTVDSFPEELNGSLAGVVAGDELYKINGERVYLSANIAELLQRYEPPYTITVIRDGKKVVLDNVDIAPRTFAGSDQLRYGFNMAAVDATFGNKLAYGWNLAMDYARLIRMSLVDLVKGKVSASDLSGPVGITATLTEYASPGNFDILWQLLAFIAINLAIMNLLPLPALDGGRVLFLLVELILLPFGKKLNHKYENYVHLVGLLLFLLLMVFVTYQDIANLIRG